MSEDPKTLEEALRVREQHEQQGHIKITRELTELIVERWPDTEEGEDAQGTVFVNQLLLDSAKDAAEMAQDAAAKAVETKREDRGYGMCLRRGCARPAAEPGGECMEHAAGTKMVETKRRKGMIN